MSDKSVSLHSSGTVWINVGTAKLVLLGEVNCICALWFETVVHSFNVFCVSKKCLYIVKEKSSCFCCFLGLFITKIA